MKEKEYLSIKNKLAKMQKNHEGMEWEKASLENELRKNFGVNNSKDGEIKLEELKRKIDRLQLQYDRMLQEFTEQWKDRLDAIEG